MNELVEVANLEEYVSQYVDLETRGNDLFGKCPIHKDDDTPSFTITPTTNLWWCFGCHKGGDILSFIREYHKVDYKQAFQILENYMSSKNDGIISKKKLETTKIIKKYKPTKKNKKVKYTVFDESEMDRFVFDCKKLKSWYDEGISYETMKKYGVKYDPMANRIVFPLRSPDGNIINIIGRTLDEDWKEKKIRKYTYYGGVGVLDTLWGIYENQQAIKESGELIVFEGSKSPMKVSQWGYENSVAALTSRINIPQMKVILKNARRVVFAFDKGVDTAKIDTVKKLCHYLPIEVVYDQENKFLNDKEAPVDQGREVWETLYKERVRIN